METEEEARSPQKRILVVDDEAEIRDIVREMLVRLGFSSETAAHGEQALNVVETDSFDLVITDIHMPGMSGLELIEKIKRSYPEIDVIAMTGFSRAYRYIDVIQVGASDFIAKPIDFNELQAKILRVFRERSLVMELQRLSTRDELTDLYNRRYFEHRGTEEVARAIRQRYPLFLLMIDIDYFKPYNDEFGHQKGDDVLRSLASVMNESVRNGVDITFRYGGDEFGVLVPQVSAGQACDIARRIRRRYLDQKHGDTSLSIGVAQIEDTGLDADSCLEQLIKHADEALYASKNEGRNRVTLYGFPPTAD